MSSRPLTYDEKKAAEAAFRGLPFDPSWSAAARAVYDGIVNASQGKRAAAEPEMFGTVTGTSQDRESESVDAPGERSSAESAGDLATQGPASDPPGEAGALPGAMSREEAIEAGLLVDVTPAAEEVGLRLPVGFTKPLWDFGITAGEQIPDDQRGERVRDVLMALRLFLERAAFTTPVMEFPALLSFPPEPVPQVYSLYVLAHKDPSTPYCLTLLHPREVAFIRLLPNSSNN